MIVKFKTVRGKNMAALFKFVHGDENRAKIPGQNKKPMVVRIMAVNPSNQDHDTWYDITLNINESASKVDGPGQDRIGLPTHFTEIYDIINRRIPPGSPEDPGTTTPSEKVIAVGINVRTTQENRMLRHVWSESEVRNRKWGVTGKVIYLKRDDLGLCCGIRHEDESIACYDSTELEIVT